MHKNTFADIARSLKQEKNMCHWRINLLSASYKAILSPCGIFTNPHPLGIGYFKSLSSGVLFYLVIFFIWTSVIFFFIWIFGVGFIFVGKFLWVFSCVKNIAINNSLVFFCWIPSLWGCLTQIKTLAPTCEWCERNKSQGHEQFQRGSTWLRL